MKCILQNMLLNTGCEISDGFRSHRQHQIFLFWRCTLLINSNFKITLWCFYMCKKKKKKNALQRHMGVWTPTGSLKLRKKPMLCFIDSSPGVWRQWGGRIFHFSLYVWTESCIPVFKVSLQTCPMAAINKVIRWARRDSEGNSMQGTFGGALWQYIVAIPNVMLHCSLGREKVLLFNFECYQTAFYLPVVCLILQCCACKWVFMFLEWEGLLWVLHIEDGST